MIVTILDAQEIFAAAQVTDLTARRIRDTVVNYAFTLMQRFHMDPKSNAKGFKIKASSLSILDAGVMVNDFDLSTLSHPKYMIDRLVTHSVDVDELWRVVGYTPAKSLLEQPYKDWHEYDVSQFFKAMVLGAFSAYAQTPVNAKLLEDLKNHCIDQAKPITA